jgi:hypothetical protein
MAAQKRDTEENAEAHGVGDAQIRSIRIAGVEEAEEHADGQNGGERAELPEHDLKAEAMEEQLFANGAA